MLTLTEVKEWLKRLEETILLEVLDINSEDIVERFDDKIEEKYEILSEELEEVRGDQDPDFTKED